MNREIAEIFISMGFSISSEPDGTMYLGLDEENHMAIGSGRQFVENELRRIRLEERKASRRIKRGLRRASYRLPRNIRQDALVHLEGRAELFEY